jgi:hypothetical protein
VKVYRFQSAAEPGGAYVIWRPTSDGSTLPYFTLTLGKKTAAATLVTPAKGKPSGEATPLPLAGGRVTLAVSERPLIVLVDRL